MVRDAGGNGRPVMAAPELLLGSPLSIQLCNRRSDGEVPTKNGDVLVFLRNSVKVRGLRCRHACFVHLLCLLFDIVKERPGERNPFLTTNGSMSGNEESVLVPGSEGLQRLPPAGHGGLCVEGVGVIVGIQKIARINDVLFGNSHDYVRPGMSRIAL